MCEKGNALDMKRRPSCIREIRNDVGRIVLIWAGVVMGLAMPQSAQAASPLPRLVVHRAPEVMDCPDARALALVVEKQMQRPVLDPAPEGADTSAYEVTIVRANPGYSATIRSGELSRDLSDPSSTCTELAEALALTLAIMLDNEPMVVPPKPAEPAPLATPPPLPPIVVRVILPSTRRWTLGVSGSIGETMGFLTPLSFAFSPEAWFRYRAATFSTGAFLLPWSTAGDTSASVKLQLWTGQLSGCGRVAGQTSHLHFDLCGQFFLGLVQGQGLYFATNRQESRPWFGLGGLGMLEGPLVSHLEWSLRLGLTVPIVTQRFTGSRPAGTVENPTQVPITLFEPAKFAGYLAFGVRWTIL